MHVAARWGRTEVVRLLLLAGSACESPQSTSNSLSAELIALSQGHNETAELLSKLKAVCLSVHAHVCACVCACVRAYVHSLLTLADVC